MTKYIKKSQNMNMEIYCNMYSKSYDQKICKTLLEMKTQEREKKLEKNKFKKEDGYMKVSDINKMIQEILCSEKQEFNFGAMLSMSYDNNDLHILKNKNSGNGLFTLDQVIDDVLLGKFFDDDVLKLKDIDVDVLARYMQRKGLYYNKKIYNKTTKLDEELKYQDFMLEHTYNDAFNKAYDINNVDYNRELFSKDYSDKELEKIFYEEEANFLGEEEINSCDFDEEEELSVDIEDEYALEANFYEDEYDWLSDDKESKDKYKLEQERLVKEKEKQMEIDCLTSISKLYWGNLNK